MNFIVFTSSDSLVTIGPCSYYLATWETIDICQYVLSYSATIGLAKCEVSIARILAICKPRNSPYTISTVSQTGNMIGFKHVFWIA